MILIYYLITLALANLCHGNPVSESSSEQSIRLPKTLKPVHYLVRLQPYINGNFSTGGFLELTFDVTAETNQIFLHINDIITHNDTVKVFPANEGCSALLPITKQEYIPDKQYYIVTMQDAFKTGSTYKISLNFQGYLNGDLKGFYRSSYTDSNGTLKWLATTQFQPTDARRAFPCMDEPGFKAKFTIEMIRQDNMTAISNMPLNESVPIDDQPGWIHDKFQTSLPMSTYLVAFIVSDFGYRQSNNTAIKYDFKVWARKDYLDQADYAVKIGPEVMLFYEDFFNVSFPLPKQYMAGIPDMSLGAMENWGLIIYRESLILYNPKASTASNKRRTGVIVAHELSHQWFGDLVTPHWWQDLWLNEGFASYMEYVGLDAVEPDFKMVDQTVVDAKHSAFTLDCLQSSHPINQPVNNPDEINQIFDTISYQKGSSIIRMMDHFLTRATFQKGLHNYLVGMSYKVAKQDDLWKYLTDQAHADKILQADLTVKTIMDTWTLQMGYPVITVKNYGNGTALLTQERFLLTENSAIKDKHDYKWWIPINYATKSTKSFEKTDPKVWMSPTEPTKNLEVPAGNGWIIFNNQATGYYRVNYDEENWKKLANQLNTNHSEIHRLNRAQLISDSLNLARSGRLSYDTALSILSYLKNETEYVPLKAALQNLGYITSMFAHTGGYGRLKNFLLSLVIPHYNRLHFKDSLSDPLLEQLLRTDILNWACGLGHKPCIEESVALYKTWMNDPTNTELISPNLKNIVYCTAISNGGEEEWKFAWKQYQTTTVSTDKNILLDALACSSDIWIISELLNRTLTPGQGIRKQDVKHVMSSVSGNINGRIPAWNFLRNKWSTFTDFFGSIFFTLDGIIEDVTKFLNTRIQLEEIQAFKTAEEGNFYSAFRTVDQAIEAATNNLEWMNNYYDVIITWLDTNGYESGL